MSAAWASEEGTEAPCRFIFIFIFFFWGGAEKTKEVVMVPIGIVQEHFDGFGKPIDTRAMSCNSFSIFPSRADHVQVKD